MKERTKEKIDFKFNLGIYLDLLKSYRLIFFGLLFISLFTVITEAVDKYLFKIVIDKGTVFVKGILEKSGFIDILIKVAVIFLLILILRSIGRWLYIHFIVKLDSSLIYDLKRKFFNHLLYLDYDFHTTHKSGSLISRLSRGARAIENMTDIIVFQFAPLIFQLLVVGSSVFYFHWVPAAIIMITVVLFVTYSYLIQYIQQGYNLKANLADDSEKGLISDVFTNIDSIKYYGKENTINERYDSACQYTKWAQIRHWSFFRWWDFGHALILGLGTFFLVLFPVMKFLKNEMSLGTVVFIFTLFGNLIAPLFMFVFGMRNFYRSMADFQSLFQYARLENRIKDRPFARALEIKQGLIEFRGVNFRYHRKDIFKDFNLKIKKNEKVALVGHSGCGKTTLVKLLYRLYDLNKGTILIDNRDIKTWKQERLRSEMAVVPQECVLFDDTIYNNIAFSNPEATREQIMKAIRFAQLHKIIEKFPDKEQTIVGERGVKLSGGEKQRVSIARAILADKKIVVLDEATSSLDSKTEHEIQRDLLKLLKNRTAIIIAHRLSTIMNSDRVIVLDDGKIVQTGRHRDLIKRKGLYRQLWELQKNGYIE